MKNILVVGGAGYIGSHMVLELINSGYNPIVLDSFRYSTRQNIETIEKITGKKIKVIQMDIRDDLSGLKLDKIDAAIHFAALKAVGKSVEKPLECYENNVGGSINLFKYLRDSGIDKLIFSSTAAVYGLNDKNPITEEFPLKPANPYASSKIFVESIIKDSNASHGLNAVILRYFNVVGCIDSGEIGDTQINVQNLVPSMILSHLGIRSTKLKVFGTDYPTKDGTGIRDYIHVMDLVKGHLKALKHLEKNDGVYTYNLGTGKGYSVMEIINTFEKVSGEKLEYEIAERRAGDVVEQYCDSSLAKKELGWEAEKNLEDMVSSMWKWYKDYFQK